MSYWSYSRINTYDICPRKYYYNYVVHMIKEVDNSESNPMLLGKTLGFMLQYNDKIAYDYYFSELNVITEEGVIWLEVLKTLAKKIKPLLTEHGEFEQKVMLDDFVGYIDWISKDKDIMFDFKLTSNSKYYEDSPQLALYAHALGYDPKVKAYLCVRRPTINYSLKTWSERGQDMIRQAEESKLEILPCTITTKMAWHEFMSKVSSLKHYEYEFTLNPINAKDSYFPKRTTAICKSCEYKDYCRRD